MPDNCFASQALFTRRTSQPNCLRAHASPCCCIRLAPPPPDTVTLLPAAAASKQTRATRRIVLAGSGGGGNTTLSHRGFTQPQGDRFLLPSCKRHVRSIYYQRWRDTGGYQCPYIHHHTSFRRHATRVLNDKAGAVSGSQTLPP